MGRLDGKVALVTGAARGTGASIAHLFAAEGARVALADVLDERGAALAKELGERALYLHLDVTREEDWERAVAAVRAAFGRVDVLVNNAAVLLIASLADTSRADFLRLVEVNQLGPFLGIRAVTPLLQEAGGGSIVNIASTDGLKGMNGVAAYASSKWGLRGITKSAAMELGRHGIRVNAICPEAGNPEMSAPYLPPGVDMEQAAAASFFQILKRPPGSSWRERIDDVARMALFLASDESASCTGADFVVDGGLTAGRVQPGIAGAR